jgi:YfiH family protein
MISVSELNEITGLNHGFFTRKGGVSTGIYESLNCGLGSQDAAENVLTNRARALACLGLPVESLVTVHQCHSDTVLILRGDEEDGAVPANADAMVTTMPGLTLGILTADCAPVLLVDRQAGVIGAAHAGWRGALNGIVDNTVAAMIRSGARASRIVAAIGPCILQRSYQVGPEFPVPFLAEDGGAVECFSTDGGGRFLFDLPRYVARRLDRVLVGKIVATNRDTYSEADMFFSYRRSIQSREPDYGRMVSIIALNP